jgi:hypothetical protein
MQFLLWDWPPTRIGPPQVDIRSFSRISMINSLNTTGYIERYPNWLIMQNLFRYQIFCIERKLFAQGSCNTSSHSLLVIHSLHRVSLFSERGCISILFSPINHNSEKWEIYPLSWLSHEVQSYIQCDIISEFDQKFSISGTFMEKCFWWFSFAKHYYWKELNWNLDSLERLQIFL